MADPASNSEGGSYDITIDDTSPTILYFPSANQNVSDSVHGWIECQSLFGAPLCNAQGGTSGTSLHATSKDGAAFRVEWVGTAISLFGYFPIDNPAYPNNLSYTVALDGVATTNYASSLSPTMDVTEDILASFSNLPYSKHYVQLSMHNPGGLSDPDSLLLFDRAVITSSPLVSSQSNTTAVATIVLPDSEVSYRGQWSFARGLIPGEDSGFHTSTNMGDSASLQFNGTAIVLSGLATPLSGSYNVTLDEGTPTTFSAHSSFNSSTILYYRTGLDAQVTHQLQIVNAGASAGEEGTLLVVGSINVTTVAQPSSSSMPVATYSHVSPGLIAGLAVGVSLAVLLFLGLVIFCLYRRRVAARRKEGFIVNPRISSFGNLSFLTRPGQSRRSEAEKGRESTGQDVLDISARKDEDDEDGTEEHVPATTTGEHLSPGDGGGNSRHASQNSDGSYAISLPELSKSHARLPAADVRTASPVPPPLSIPPNPQPSRHLSISHSASPRSPKPRGPRDMNVSLPGHSRDPSSGILLREMYTAAADVPSDVRESDTGTLTTNRHNSFLPVPAAVSPLRVNFDGEITGTGEPQPQSQSQSQPQRRDAKHRSATSALSLPRSLRHLFSWHQDPHRRSTSQYTIPESTRLRREEAGYSFLDMESTVSGSAISGGRSTPGHSRAPSTLSTGKSSRSAGAHASEWSAPGRVDVPVPPLTHSSSSSSPLEVAHRHPGRASMGFSMTIAGGPTSSQPSLSPDISLQAVPLPQLTVSHGDDAGGEHRHDDDEGQDVPISAHPHELDALPSPTESIPRTVSELHFRHSSMSSTAGMSVMESRRASGQVRYSVAPPRSPHPPLPSPRSPGMQMLARQQQQRHVDVEAGESGEVEVEERPYIVQKLLGRHPNPESAPSSPFSTPTTQTTFRQSGTTRGTPVRGSLRGSFVGPSFTSVIRGSRT